MERGPKIIVGCAQLDRQIPCDLLNPKVRYRIHKSKRAGPNSERNDPVHTSKSHTTKILRIKMIGYVRKLILLVTGNRIIFTFVINSA